MNTQAGISKDIKEKQIISKNTKIQKKTYSTISINKLSINKFE